MHGILAPWPWFSVLILLLSSGGCQPKPQTMTFEWTSLAPLPDNEGFAAPFAGVSNGTLIVAGGAKFPDKRPWEGGVKKWYDTVYALPSPEGTWKVAGHLPKSNAYGLSVSTPAGIICAGGGDAQAHFRDVYCLRYANNMVTITPLPPLPKPCAFMSGSLVGDHFYIAGGIEMPGSTTCLNSFWTLDTNHPEAGWRELPPCPGPPRMLAVAGSAGDSFYLFSGARLFPTDGKAAREYLRDAWKYSPNRGWTRLADLPRPAVAAASPAPLVSGGSNLLVLSGDDGAHVGFEPPAQHPGFPRDVLVFDVRQEQWSVLGAADRPLPFSRATVPATFWRHRWIVPTGEARPGYRSPEVWALSD